MLLLLLLNVAIFIGRYRRIDMPKVCPGGPFLHAAAVNNGWHDGISSFQLGETDSHDSHGRQHCHQLALAQLDTYRQHETRGPNLRSLGGRGPWDEARNAAVMPE